MPSDMLFDEDEDEYFKECFEEVKELYEKIKLRKKLNDKEMKLLKEIFEEQMEKYELI